MVRRCTEPARVEYPNYGGRGITVCDRWLDFDNYIADVGYPPAPGLTLDRIDNDGNYEPGNVRWATWSEQNFNRRNATFDLPECANGHSRAVHGTYLSGDGRMRCCQCRREGSRRYYYRTRLREMPA